MGTRSITSVVDDGKRIVSIYQQFDGYPEVVGKELAEFLAKITVGNGISYDARLGAYANGAGCLAAQLIKQFKERVGGLYIVACGDGDLGQEYEYEIHVADTRLEIECIFGPWRKPRESLFKGTPAEFLEWLSKREEATA